MRQTYRIVAVSGVDGKGAKVDAHANWCFSIIVELVELLKDLLELITGPVVVVVVPRLVLNGIDLGRESSDNAEIVTSALHGPEEIRVVVVVDLNLTTITEDDLEADNVVTDETVFSFVPAVTATESKTSVANTLVSSRR